MARQVSYNGGMRAAPSSVASILRADPLRWHLLGVVSALRLPDCWIGAGFVRNAVWDHLHGRLPSPPQGDVDVIWYDDRRTDPEQDRHLETSLTDAEPSVVWSVKNQARMHVRNADQPYRSSTDAMRFWPETATAIAARRTEEGNCEIAAPLGLDDLFRLVIRPTSRFTTDKHDMFKARVDDKDWLTRWPRLRM
jgi:hypothetical protein